MREPIEPPDEKRRGVASKIWIAACALLSAYLLLDVFFARIGAG